MKTTLTIVLLGFITLFHGQSLNSDTYWIATKSSQLKKNSGIYPKDGTIIHFEEKQVEISHVFYDSIQTHLLKLKNKKIFLQDTLWGEIKHLDNDSLLIDFDKIMRVKFKPLSKNIDFKTKLSFWNFTDWVFSFNGYLQELKLLETLWDKYPNRIAKLCVTQSQGKRYKHSNPEKWNIKEINRNHIFVKTSGQFNYEIYKVKKYNNDTVVLESLTYEDTSIVKLIKEPVITQTKKNRIVKLLQKHKWNTNELIYNVNSFDSDSLGLEYEPFGFILVDTTLFKKTSLLNNQLSYVFSESLEYKIFESDTLRISGKWRLSNSGKQIVLNDGYSPEDYIDLINLATDTITIGKSDMFHVGEKKNDFVDYYYRLILIK